jgi:hypothetical protein
MDRAARAQAADPTFAHSHTVRMSRRSWLLAVAVTLAGMAIAYVDTRPRFDDTGVIVAAVTLLAALAALLGRRRPWLWALLSGIWVPLLEISGGGQPESLVALVFAGLAAAAGYALAAAVTPASTAG